MKSRRTFLKLAISLPVAAISIAPRPPQETILNSANAEWKTIEGTFWVGSVDLVSANPQSTAQSIAALIRDLHKHGMIGT